MDRGVPCRVAIVARLLPLRLRDSTPVWRLPGVLGAVAYWLQALKDELRRGRGRRPGSTASLLEESLLMDWDMRLRGVVGRDSRGASLS